jgi:NAD-dependent deacetylase
MKRRLVVLSGAGISAESGLATFRGACGLWEGYDIMEVASIEGWRKNPRLVIDFYNMRRTTALEALPNRGHETLAALESDFEVHIITQNVDLLHEKAGSLRVLHLHGRLDQLRSSLDPTLTVEWKEDLVFGQKCPRGSQLRPNIVWFGEAVPAMNEAIRLAHLADIFVVVGTSLQVYPAANLVHEIRPTVPAFLVDPEPVGLMGTNWTTIARPASEGIPILREMLLDSFH